MAAFFDYIQFIISEFILFQKDNISKSIIQRYSNIQILTNFLLCRYALRNTNTNGKHQMFSMISMGIVLIIQVIIEIIYNIRTKEFFVMFTVNIINLVCSSLNDVIEKYLGDTDFTIPYIITMGEGIFIFIMNLIYTIHSIINKNYFEQIKKLLEPLNSSEISLLVFLFFLYIFLSAIINIYKIHCNIFTSPVKRVSFHYFLIPLYIIYTFFYEHDFKTDEGKTNTTFFILSEILIIFCVLLGLVYNEYILLLFFGLAKDTIYEINKRNKDVKDYSLGSEYDFDSGDYGVDFNNLHCSQINENLV